MMNSHRIRMRCGLIVAALATMNLLPGCATRAPAHDYTAFLRNKPASLLVLPPLNESPEIDATAGVWSHATRPLAEAGYYVLPATLVDETFRENGITAAQDAQSVAPGKLREFFGADAAVYLKVKRYGTSYAILTSETRVEVEARIIDLRSGELLWSGTAVASSAEEQAAQSNLVALLVTAVVNQIVGTATDASFRYAMIADQRLLGAPRYNGVLPGPRSPLAALAVTSSLAVPVAATGPSSSSPSSSNAAPQISNGPARAIPGATSTPPPAPVPAPVPASPSNSDPASRNLEIVRPASKHAEAGSGAQSSRKARIGTDDFAASRFARSESCHPSPAVTLIAEGAGFEDYEVDCANGGKLSIRCEFGNCRRMN